MKNKIIYILSIFFLCINQLYSEELNITFETKTIEISNEGSLVKANFGKVISKDKNFEVTANYFEYDKSIEILNIKGNGNIYIKEFDLKINFEKAEIDQKKSTFTTYRKIQLQNKNLKLDIYSKKIIYDFEKKILLSNSNTTLEYGNQEKLTGDNFKYEINNNLLKIKNFILIDENKNRYNSSLAFINTKTNNLFAKDIYLKLNNKTLNDESEPRLKGNSLKDNEEVSEITKGIFTNCKIRDGCPPWEVSAKKITHNKKDKMINYEDAIIKIYNKPIAYFPKFAHPDPTAERKSGFLTPSLSTSLNNENYFTIPYYFVVSENKDLTFSPRIYDHEQILLQTEYRQVGKDSMHLSDFGLKVSDNKKLRSHFFYNFDKSFNFKNFLNNKIDLNFQAISKDTYLKKNKIKSNLINNENILENSAKITLYKDDTTINVNGQIFEDLTKEESDRYEYVFPNIRIKKRLNNLTSSFGNLFLDSKAILRNYNTNINETININNLIFSSYPNISKKGFFNNYEFFITNANTDSKNSKNFKNKKNSILGGIFQFNSTLPLIKENENYKKISKPRISLKVSPNYTKDNRNGEIELDLNNIYSINRVARDDAIEGGISLTYGNEFSIFDKKNSFEKFRFEIANNLRLKENFDLPKNSQIGQKTSSIFNKISFNPIRNIKIKYDSSIKNNLQELNYENLTTEFKINNIVTSFDYFNQNETNNISYISNTTKLLYNDFNTISFSTRKNNILNSNEYYNLSYQYENDCLNASIEYQKDYYSDRDLKPNENLTFKITIIPFNKKSNL
jgi:LPS-assembly protein